MLKVHSKKLGNVAILCLQGRIVRGETQPLSTAVNFQSEASAVVLDLTNVSTIDAGGLGVLLTLREETQAKGIEFRLINVRPLVNKVLEITRLDSVFDTTLSAQMLSRMSGAPLEALRACA